MSSLTPNPSRLRALSAAVALLGALVVAAPATPATAAQSPATCLPAISMTNGGFEQPVISANNYAVLHQSAVPGWSTTAGDQAIEIWSSPFLGFTAAAGQQFAELNANQVATLYQDLATIPGQVLRWSLNHRGREGVDVMTVSLGAPSGPLVQQGPAISDNNLAWGSYSGQYTVPAGQTVTRFAFNSVSSAGGSGGVGNLLDNVSLGTAACVVTTKSVANLSGTATARVGDTLEYSVTAENRGGSPATSASIIDTIPAGLTFVPGSLVTSASATDASGDDAAEIVGSTVTARIGDGATAASGGSIPAGESRTLTFRVKVALAAAATTVTNEATTRYTESFAGTPATSVSNETVTVVENASDLGVTQSLAAPLSSGGAAQYTITVANNGSQSLADATLSSTLPALQGLSENSADCSITAGVLDCEFGTLAPGASRTIVVTGTVPAATAGGTPYSLTSVVGTTTVDTDPSNDTATRTDAVTPVAAIGVSATITDATPASTVAGESLQATYLVTNTGNLTLTAVSVSDPLFGSITCVTTTLAPGASTTCSADAPYLVTAADASAGSVATTVTVQGTPPVGSGLAVASSTAAASIAVAVPVAAGPLVTTGVDPALPVLLALGLLLIGAAMTLVARRRAARLSE